MQSRYIEFLDTTLRDGAQGEGIVFSLEDKIRIIRALDALGVDYIEAGNPASNPRDAELFRYAAANMPLQRARLAAFGSTCRPGSDAADSAELRAVAECGAKTASIFGKASPRHVERVLQTTREENLRIIRESVSWLTERGIEVLFDAEHFFDGFAEDPDYAVSALRAAYEAGAARLVLCDTNGGSLPEEIARGVRAAREAFADVIGLHCHNDSGLAAANAIAGLEAGARHLQGTINGYGERCGNLDLCTAIPNCAVKLGCHCLREGGLEQIGATARLVADVANLPMNEKAPYVGHSAFAHKGGMHIDAMLKDSGSFEHVDPAALGARRRYLVSDLAGRGALMTRLALIDSGLRKDSAETARLLAAVKELEAQGYSFEGADASLRLRLLEMLGRRPRYFELLDFHVVSRKPEDAHNAQAYVKVRVDGQVEITADEGDGPVNAIDLAVRKALSRFFPCIGRMRLKDFKVRVVNSAGTASSVRVQIESTDGEHVWATVGVSSNIIEASVIALTDAVEYLLLSESESWQI